MNAVYVTIEQAPTDKTVELIPGKVFADYSEDGTLIGIEVIGVRLELNPTTPRIQDFFLGLPPGVETIECDTNDAEGLTVPEAIAEGRRRAGL